MPVIGCSDCGQPSVGIFDVEPKPLGYNPLTLENSKKGLYDRPLCASCATARGLKTPGK